MKVNKSATQKITFAAIATALASVMIILTNFLPLRISLLMLSALCYFLVFDKAGLFYGFLTIAASILISFFTKPFSSAFFLTVLVFAPYSVLAYFIKKLLFTNVKTVILRIAIMIAYSSLSFFAVYAFMQWLAAAIDFEVLSYVLTYSYIGITLLYSLAFIVFDFMFNQLSIRISKLIK